MVAIYMQTNPYLPHVSMFLWGAVIVAMVAVPALVGWVASATVKRMVKAIVVAAVVAIVVASAQSTLFAFYMECAGWWCCDSWWCF